MSILSKSSRKPLIIRQTTAGSSTRPYHPLRSAPCQSACLCGTNIRELLACLRFDQRNVSRGQAMDDAWDFLVQTNPMPATIAHICPHECMNACNRSKKDDAINVNAIEKEIGLWGLGLRSLPKCSITRSEKIAIVGAGPASLSAAYQLAKLGYGVTIFSDAEPGGMLRAIPQSRLPRNILNREIEKILACGITLIRKHVAIEELSSYDAIFVGSGAPIPRSLGIPGERFAINAIQYLLNNSQHLGKVAIIGGGMTAIDAALVVREHGSDVMLYRALNKDPLAASKEGLPECIDVWPIEIRSASNQAGKLQLITRKVNLGPAKDGWPTLIPYGDEIIEEFDNVVIACSQMPDPDMLGKDVHYGGDVVALGTAAGAIKQGRGAAESIHAHFSGVKVVPMPEPIESCLIKLELYESCSSDNVTCVQDALKEAQRCLSCGSCYKCGRCWLFCTYGCFKDKTLELDLKNCNGCGKCVDVCPCGGLAMM